MAIYGISETILFLNGGQTVNNFDSKLKDLNKMPEASLSKSSKYVLTFERDTAV